MSKFAWMTSAVPGFERWRANFQIPPVSSINHRPEPLKSLSVNSGLTGRPEASALPSVLMISTPSVAAKCELIFACTAPRESELNTQVPTNSSDFGFVLE